MTSTAIHTRRCKHTIDIFESAQTSGLIRPNHAKNSLYEFSESLHKTSPWLCLQSSSQYDAAAIFLIKSGLVE